MVKKPHKACSAAAQHRRIGAVLQQTLFIYPQDGLRLKYHCLK